MKLCEMWDGPVSLWEVSLAFALLVVIGALAGWFRGSKIRPVSVVANVVLGCVVLFSIWSGWKTARWGIAPDAGTCVPFGSGVTLATVVVLNLAVIAAARLARRARLTHRDRA